MEKRESVLINPELHRRLKQLAAEQRRPMGVIADEYLTAALAKEEKRKARVA